MGAFSRAADQHAEETGSMEALDMYLESLFSDKREDLAEQIASDQKVKIGNKVIDFETVVESLYYRDKELMAAFKLCMVNSSLGGIHIKRLITEVAQEVIDDLESDIQESFKKELEEGEQL